MLALKPYQFVQDGKSLIGSYMGSCKAAHDVPRFIDLYKTGRLPIDRLRSANIRLEDINEGFDKLADAATVRQVIVFD